MNSKHKFNPFFFTGSIINDIFLLSQDGHEPNVNEKISMSISKYDDCSLFSIRIELFLSFFAEDT